MGEGFFGHRLLWNKGFGERPPTGRAEKKKPKKVTWGICGGDMGCQGDMILSKLQPGHILTELCHF